MKGIKKFFNQFVLSFALICAFVCGITFLTTGRADKQSSDAAEIYEDVSNALPPYFVATPESGVTSANGQGAENQDLFLMTPGKKVALSMTNGFVETEDSVTKPKLKNPAFFPDINNKETYYYFGNFENPLALYYNLTNKDVQNGTVGENLLAGQNTNQFVKNGEFVVPSYDVMPSRFELSFSLDTTQSNLTFEQNNEGDSVSVDNFKGANITLNKEGCYTLVIPYTYLYAENGEIVDSAQDQIYYTFMVFNSTTYLDSASQQPNTQISSFVQTSALPNSTTYSRYYFYNFDDNPSNSGESKTAGNMPEFSYNPSLYDITIEYTDINEEDEHRFFTFTLQPAGEGFALQVVDENEQPVSADGCPIRYEPSSNNPAKLYFNELGVYDISFSFVSRKDEKVYKLPFECKKQRLYVFGYQALYTTTERDQNNMTKSKELKKFGPEAKVDFNQYAKSADITSMLDLAPIQRETDLNAYANLLNGIESKLSSITPISTNMTPVKFRANPHVSLVKDESHYYEVNDGEIGTEKSFVGDNFTKTGTYLVVAVYNFQDFLTTTGTNAGTYYHYQVFYFTITDFTPSVSIKDADGGDIYRSGYTNKDVYIIDNSAGADYEAEVTITLSAQDYSRGQNAYFFRDVDIKTLPGSYSGITYEQNLGDKFGNKPGVHISVDSPYHNANFEVKIYSSNSVKPSEVNFTIDTNDIGSITAKNVSFISSSEYLISSSVPSDSNLTNQPMIFMWNEKASRVPTHAYYRFFPIVNAQYYHTENPESSNNQLLKSLLEFAGHSGVLPTNNMLDLTRATDWQDYNNALPFSESSTVPSTFVRSEAGLYLFEVFDEAGNYHFEVFLLDNTTPIFVKQTQSTQDLITRLSVLSTSDTLTVTETETYRILWGSKKGLYINGLTSASGASGYLPEISHYSLDGITFGSENPLSDCLYAFFGAHSLVLNNIEANVPSGSAIKSYNSRYITIDLLQQTYIERPKPSGYFPENTLQSDGTVHAWDIEQTRLNDNSEIEANEGAYKFLVRDWANTKISNPNSPSANAFRQAPSAHLTVNITSDSSRLTFFLGNNPENFLTMTGFSTTGRFYQGETVESDADLHKNNASTYTESNYTFKYQYYSPINTTLPLTLSYIPYAFNDSQIATLTMEYYPFVKTTDLAFDNIRHDYSQYQAYANYYTISQIAERTETVFDLTTQNEGSIPKDSGNGETAFQFNLAVSGDAAAPGKYVFTRKYVIGEGAKIDQYDYYERTLTLIVDRFDLITSRETVEHGDDVSTESYVGGEIMLTMYSNANQTDISIAYPYYDEGTGLNKGSLFSSSSSTMKEDNDPSSIALTTNKVPVALNVPKYKFTCYNVYDATNNSYAVQINDELSYYAGYAIDEEETVVDGEARTIFNVYAAAVFKKDESEKIVVDTERSLFRQSFNTKDDAQAYIDAQKISSSIAEYEIYAKVKFVPLSNQNSTIWYRSNGTTTDGGFLKFFQVDGDDGEDRDFSDAPEIKNFTTPGTYVVTLYQAHGQSAETEGDAAFNRLYKFSFSIKSGRPDFDILTEDESLLDPVDNSQNEEQFYTNSKKIRVQWTDDPSEFMAKIDKDSIRLEISEGTGVRTINGIADMTKEGIVIADTTNKSHYFDFSFDSSKWQNGNYIRISMRFEGYDTMPNSIVSKCVYVDYTAPFERLASLMDKTTAATTDPTTGIQYFSRLFQESNMRSLFMADNRTRVQTGGWTNNNFAQEMENVSYSYSAGDGTYRSYSYMVTQDFFQSAYQALLEAPRTPTATQNMYVRKITSSDSNVFNTYDQTTKDAFNPLDTNFISIKGLEDDIAKVFPSGNYYEIVETDQAGNMVVYIVYLQSSAENHNIAISYTNKNKTEKGEEDEAVSTAQIVDGFNIYSNTGFEITSLNYNDDAWGLYKVTINGITTTYMSSPWLEKETGDIYRLGSGAPTPVSFGDIFAGLGESRTKQGMTLADRTNGNALQIKISIMDESLSTRHYSSADTATLEILDVPSLAEVNSNTAYVFPKTIKVAYWSAGDWNWSLLGEDGITNPTDDPTAWATLAAEKTDLATFEYANGNLIVTIKIANDIMERFKYTITDNFGYTFTELQLVNEKQFDEVTGPSTIYEFTESDLSKTYLSDDSITFNYNAVLYNAVVYRALINGAQTENPSVTPTPPNADRISLITLNAGSGNYDYVYFIELYENGAESEGPIRFVNLRVYNNMPIFTDKTGNEKPDENNVWFLDKNNKAIEQQDLVHFDTSVVFDGKTFSGQATSIRTFSNIVTLFVDDGQVAMQEGSADWEKAYSYSVHISADGQVWTTIDNTNGYTLAGVGSYYILIKYDDSDVFTNLFELYLVEILNSDTVSYSFFVDDHEVSPTRGFKYTDSTGVEHYTVYVLSVAYNEKDSHVTIIPNEEKQTTGLDSPRLEPYRQGDPVRVEIYTYDSTNAKGATFAVIYIGKTDTILHSLGYEGQNGLTEDLLQPQWTDPANPPNIIVEDANFNTLKLSYSNYWGIEENAVNIEVQKLFDGEYRMINTQTYQDNSQPDVNYVLLTRAGSYRVKFFDSCETPNVHLFGQNESEYITLNFISSVPFTISYVDPISGEPTVSEPINRAIYNGDVTLTLTNPTKYFASGYPVIHATKDGEAYEISGRNTYTFTESGHYVVYFEAYAIGNNETPLRTENYSFSIIKADESRFAFEYATFAGYYIKQILRDGVDVTRRFVEILDDNKITRTEYDQSGKPVSVQYLTNLQISYFDEKTVGAVDRRFVVTIETGEQTYASITATSFTFAFRINMATPPLSISIDEGGATTNTIQVQYNVRDIYQSVGDCRIVLPGQDDIIIDSAALAGEAERTATITAFGTGYVQVYSASGNLLFSYKVTRNQPLGVWEIIAIVIGVLAAAAIVFVAIKLRKRLKVK